MSNNVDSSQDAMRFLQLQARADLSSLGEQIPIALQEAAGMA